MLVGLGPLILFSDSRLLPHLGQVKDTSNPSHPHYHIPTEKISNACQHPKLLCPIFLFIYPYLEWTLPFTSCPLVLEQLNTIGEIFIITCILLLNSNHLPHLNPQHHPAILLNFSKLFSHSRQLFQTFASFFKSPILPFQILSKYVTLHHRDIWHHKDQCDWSILSKKTVLGDKVREGRSRQRASRTL